MSREEFRYTGYIAEAKQTIGGHLHVGRGGFTLHFGTSRLSGYDCDHVKSLCIAAGLPVIDSREAPIELVAKLGVSGPMIAVNRHPDPHPWHALAYAPLGAIAAAYRRAGAEVFNMADSQFDESGFEDGTVRTLRKRWNANQRYLSEPMMRRLRAAPEKPISRVSPAEDCLRLGAAALEAGVTAATIINWANAGDLERVQTRTGWHYPRRAVRARARLYWQHVRFQRAVPPEWLRAETGA